MVAVLHPTSNGKVIAIDRAVVRVGRGSDCDAIITDSQKISRRHCCLVQVDDSFFVRDLGSMNGVWVNGERVNREEKISTGDKIQIGDVEFQFHPNVRIEPKKTVVASDEQDAVEVLDEPIPQSPAVEEIADVVATSAEDDEESEEIALFHTGQIKLVDVKDLDAAEDGDQGDVIEEVEVINDVVLLDDNDPLLLETNEVEIVDEPLVDDEIVDVTRDDDDDEIVIFED